MKKLSLSLIALMLLTFSFNASARDSHHRRSHHSNYGFSFNNYGHRYNDHYYGNRFYGNRHYGFSYSSGHHSSGAGWLLGGLVLGSALSNHYREPTVIYRTEPVVVRNVVQKEIVYVKEGQTKSSSAIASGRRLLKDLEGNCFERIVDENGNELRTQLEAEECNF